MHKGETFEDRQVYVDGNEFDGCQFVRCELTYGGGTYALTNNRFAECSWTFDGPAMRTAQCMAISSGSSVSPCDGRALCGLS